MQFSNISLAFIEFDIINEQSLIIKLTINSKKILNRIFNEWYLQYSMTDFFFTNFFQTICQKYIIEMSWSEWTEFFEEIN